MSKDRDPLRATCNCGRRVRVLWSGPIGKTSRPVLLVCGFHPRPRCTFRQGVPPEAVSRT